MYLDLRAALLGSSSLFLQNLALNLPPDLRLMLSATPVESEPLDAVSGFIQFTGAFLNGFLAIVGVFLLLVLDIKRSNLPGAALCPTSCAIGRDLWEAIEARLGACAWSDGSRWQLASGPGRLLDHRIAQRWFCVNRAAVFEAVQYSTSPGSNTGAAGRF
jgi:hypothetical protein